ncbi:MAG: cation transporter [Acidiferrobacterales bacterium]
MGISETQFEINGMKCDGCVAKATAAIKSVAGITDTQVELAGKSAVVKGSADPKNVIEALKKAGYSANVRKN